MEEAIPEDFRNAMQAQQQALEAYQNLWNSFPKDELGEPIYPEDYAGAYLDDDGNLIIQLTEVTPAAENQYNLRCVDTEKVRFREAAYSVNELLGFETYVQDYIDAGYEVVTSGISVTNNRFEISLNEDMARFTGPSRTMAARAAGAPIALSYQAPVEATATLWGGDRIVNNDSKKACSYGIGGTYNGSPAFLTCGHGNSVNDNLLYGGSVIGRVSFSRACTSEAALPAETLGDFAIVNVTDSSTTASNLVGGMKFTGTYSSLPEGTKIYKYGAVTQLSTGTVRRSMGLTLCAYGDPPYYARGLYESSISAVAPGDSGGPVYIKNGSSYLIHGVATARDTSKTGTLLLYSTPIYYAMDVGFQPKLN